LRDIIEESAPIARKKDQLQKWNDELSTQVAAMVKIEERLTGELKDLTNEAEKLREDNKLVAFLNRQLDEKDTVIEEMDRELSDFKQQLDKMKTGTSFYDASQYSELEVECSGYKK
jgi:predicted RNase H-like nuclease (RuvC/YqgF family)